MCSFMYTDAWAQVHTTLYIHTWVLYSYILTRARLAGDGICQSPEEYPGFGRFGCTKDCGVWRSTTKLYINMQDFFDQLKTQDGWDVARATPGRPNPRFSYNIWSE